MMYATRSAGTHYLARLLFAGLIALAVHSAAAEQPGRAAESLLEAAVLGDPSASVEASGTSGEPSAEVPGGPLELETCVRIALNRNPHLQATSANLVAAHEAVGVSQAASYPDIYLTAGYRRFDAHLWFPSDFSLHDSALGTTDDWSAGATAGYTVYDSGQRKADQKSASAGLAAARHDASSVRQDIIFRVHTAFYRVASSAAGLGAAEARLERRRDHLELALHRYEAGAVARSDVLRAEVDVAGAELAVVRAEAAVQQARGELNTAMGLPVDLQVDIESPPEIVSTSSVLNAREAVDLALQQRSELAAARERIQVAERRADSIKAAFSPRIRAEGSYGWRDSDFLPEDRNWSVGLSLRVPVFSGFAKTHRVGEAVAETRKLEAYASAIADDIQQQVWNALIEVAEARQAVQETQVLLDTSRESHEFAVARYEAGAATMTDLLDAETSLSEADAAHIESIFGYRLAQSRLQRVQQEL